MKRANLCRVCGSTDPDSGWAGDKRTLCKACVISEHTRRTSEARLAQEKMYADMSPDLRKAMIVAAAMGAGLRWRR